MHNRNLGSAGNGTEHYILQRASAIFLMPLSVWFIISVVSLSKAVPQEIAEFIRSPIHFTTAVLFISMLLLHGVIGMKIVIEDYIHSTFCKYTVIMLLYFVAIFSFIASITAILNLHIMIRLFN